MNTDFITLFVSFLTAFIVKDFYDITISKHIRLFFEKHKKEIVELVKTGENKKKYNKKR